LDSSKAGLRDGRFAAFQELMYPFLLENMCLQAEAGLDAIAIFDTSAGDFSFNDYRDFAVPLIKNLVREFKLRHPMTPVVYYSKNTNPEHWLLLEDSKIDGLGVDWNHNLAMVLDRFSERWSIQGNIDPHFLRDDSPRVLEEKIRAVFKDVKALPMRKRQNWVCGLGHGVLQFTPEANVHHFIKVMREVFR
jgi:uroporphyrinogen decarboxylase